MIYYKKTSKQEQIQIEKELKIESVDHINNKTILNRVVVFSITLVDGEPVINLGFDKDKIQQDKAHELVSMYLFEIFGKESE